MAKPDILPDIYLVPKISGLSVDLLIHGSHQNLLCKHWYESLLSLSYLSVQTQSSHMNLQNIRDKAHASPMRRKLNTPIGTDWICSVQSTAKSVLCCPQHTSLPSFSHILLKSLAHWCLHLCRRNSRSTWTAVTSSLSCRPSMTCWNRLWGKVSRLFIK